MPRQLVMPAVVLALCFSASAMGQTTSREVLDGVKPNSKAEAQAAGDYGSMTRPSVPLGAIQQAWDAADQKAGVYAVKFRGDEVIRLRVREFMPTTVVFPEWEEIKATIVGDKDGLLVDQVSPRILIIRAGYVGADGGVTVIGKSGLVYPFYVRLEGVESKFTSDVKVTIQAENPAREVIEQAGGAAREPERKPAADAPAGREGAAAKPESQAGLSHGEREDRRRGSQTGESSPDYLTPVKVSPENISFEFTMSGDRSIAPERVYSDGVFTFFDYGSRWDASDLPVVYRVVDGVDTPVNTRVRGGKLIAETTGAFTLRNGQRVVCIRPKDYVPDGSFAPSKTPATRTAETPREITP